VIESGSLQVCLKVRPVRPSQVLDLKRSAVKSAALKYRVTNLRVFGSVAQGTDLEGSDLDILVDALPGTTLLDLGGLQEELGKLLGLSVDLRTPLDLPERFRASVLLSAKPL
jgi:uncharacterized protein